MFTSSTGMALSMSCRSACTAATARIVSGDSVTAAMREVEPRVGLPVLGRVGRGRRPRRARSTSRSRCSGVAGRGRPRCGRHPARRPGGTPACRAAASLRGTERPGAAGRRLARPVADHRAAAAAAGGLHEVGGAQRRDRLAQRRPRDAHPLGELALRRQRACRAGRPRAGSRWRAARRSPRTRGARGPRRHRWTQLDRSARGWGGPTRRQSRDIGVTASMPEYNGLTSNLIPPGLWTGFRARR